MADIIYTWRGEWKAGVSYRVNDTVERDGVAYLCQNSHLSAAASWPGGPSIVWEELMDEETREDPFYYKEMKGVGKPTYHVCIDQGNDTALVVFGDIEEILDARNLTNQLNNSVYRWMAKRTG